MNLYRKVGHMFRIIFLVRYSSQFPYGISTSRAWSFQVEGKINSFGHSMFIFYCKNILFGLFIWNDHFDIVPFEMVTFEMMLYERIIKTFKFSFQTKAQIKVRQIAFRNGLNRRKYNYLNIIILDFDLFNYYFDLFKLTTLSIWHLKTSFLSRVFGMWKGIGFCYLISYVSIYAFLCKSIL